MQCCVCSTVNFQHLTIANYRYNRKRCLSCGIYSFSINIKLNKNKDTDHIKDADAACVLSYAIIMLNVDQHSPKVACKMTPEDFVRNLRGANSGEDFDRALLEQIFNNIHNNEIVLPEEHDGELREEALWKALVARSRLPTSQMTSVNDSPQFDAAIFSMLANPLKLSLAFVLEAADEKVSQCFAVLVGWWKSY